MNSEKYADEMGIQKPISFIQLFRATIFDC